MRYLGIDYGTKKVGLALSDEAGSMGFPHAMLTQSARLLDEVAALVRDKGVGCIVMGESRAFGGQENPVAAAARAFADLLATATGIAVHFEPETYTTQAARRYPDGSRMEGSPDVDSSAAALILTSYLERMQNPSTTPSDDQSQEPGEAQDRDTVPQEPAVIPLVAPEPAAETAPTVEKFISIDDFAKVQIKVGTVLSAERVPDTEKLLRLMIDLGEPEPRQIVSGIASYVAEPETLVGRQLAFVANLAPRKLRGLESNGMLFAVGEGETFAFMTPDGPVPPGTSAH